MVPNIFRAYKIDEMELIGKGGFGEVYLVRVYGPKLNKDDAPKYAIKILSYTGNDETNQMRRFAREVLCQSKFNHPNIVPVVLHSLQCDEPWFIMELAESSLEQDLKKGNLEYKEKLAALKMLLEAVRYIHNYKESGISQGYVHRDIKPGNILRFSDGTYKLSDFGLVRARDLSEATKLTSVNVVFVSGKYTAPEVREAGQYSAQSDIYSIGKVIMDLNLGEQFDLIADKCTMDKPSRRYASVEEIIKEIGEIGDND
ncbi:serine/threonine protein kinase [Pasteurella multocida]|uniref:serine/threonine-protein kinase n=1 Tax=Pasteurella multocida TaxID=747 RepID=UPI00201FE4F5|nr:serine/threonine-protein kinase [Pasteurella multocida]MCL7815254.1 serine/threonine protein kinase [Pasteurella multocida]MDY0640397.1 serine/threonine protein kinase [Pasteurella multocida]HDR1026120.1 serine/threonine protein kinase [Pasteurella multocida]